MKREAKGHLGYLEIQVTDSCNLCCKGCSHCAGLFGPRAHIPVEQAANDLRRLRELTPDIRRIRLVGGEPLLHPDLARYVQEARRAYPHAEIQTVTNGLLIPGVSEDLLSTMRMNRVSFDVSAYPPTLEMRTQIEARLNAADVQYAFTPPVTHFVRRITFRSEKSAAENFENCGVRWCHFLRGGVLSPCPAPVILEKLAAVYGLSVDTAEGQMDLYRDALSGEEIIDWLNRPSPVCRYCGEAEPFPWQAHKKPALSDWIRSDGMPLINETN